MKISRSMRPAASFPYPGNFKKPTGRRFLSLGWVDSKGDGDSGARILPPSGLRPPPLHGLFNNAVEGEKCRVYNKSGKEVTLPHLMGKGWGWGFRFRQTLPRCDFNQPMGGKA